MNLDDIITREEYEDIGKINYNQFSLILGKIVKLCVEEALIALPGVMNHLTKQIEYLKTLSNNFYNDNKDLIPHKVLVSKIIEQVDSENSGKSYEETLKISAVRARIAIKNLDKKCSDNRSLEYADNTLKDI